MAFMKIEAGARTNSITREKALCASRIQDKF